MRKFDWLMISVGIIGATILLLNSCAHAHDRHFPVKGEMHDWFMDLKSGKGPCCSDADGNVVKDADWETKDGHYRVRIENEWLDVPDDALVTVPNLYGQTIVWPIRFDGILSIRCFMPGSMT